MTHIDPRLDKLVEALNTAAKQFRKYQELHCFKGKVDKAEANGKMAEMCENAVIDFKASTPLKEFAGLRKDQWNTLYEYLRDREAWEEWEEEYSTACRQIAEGLSK